MWELGHLAQETAPGSPTASLQCVSGTEKLGLSETAPFPPRTHNHNALELDKDQTCTGEEHVLLESLPAAQEE